MALVRWESAGDYGSLQREINQLFSSFADGRGGRRAAGWVPAIDLRETQDGYVLLADLPGVSADDVAIDVERNVLTLSGARSRPDQGAGLLRAERGFGSFRRRLTMPEGVDPDEIVASFDRGVLEIRIPKPVKARPRRISIDGDHEREVIDAGRGDDAAGDEHRASSDLAV
jgi:HSP20 family protein